MTDARARLWRELSRLAALCLGVYFLGLTTHGLTNWQEAQRALVAREMATANDGGAEWIVPTVHGIPYLAKPPMIYWAQLTLAKLTGNVPSLVHLRLTVALAATLAVFLTYFAARRMLNPPDDDDPAQASPAWWAAAFLGTGILAVRSGRIGELDALLLPLTVGGVWALYEAWRTHRERKRTNWLAVVLACLCAAGAGLSKGPPGVLPIFLAAYGGMVLRAAWTPPLVAGPGERWMPIGLASLAAVVIVAARWSAVHSTRDAFGLAILATTGGAVAALLARMLETRRVGMTWAALTRTHPVGLLLAGLAPIVIWSRLVASHTDPELVRAAASTEATENLNLLVPESPINNLEAMSYGVGLGSIAAIAALVWIVHKRPALTLGVWMILAWVGLGFAAFSLLGKGVPRYLTPLWPGVAMLGAWWFAAAIRNLAIGPTLARVGMIAVAILATGQALWYGIGRELLFRDRSPEALCRDLLEREQIDPSSLVVVDLWHPALDYYAGQPVEPVAVEHDTREFAFVRAIRLADVRERVVQGEQVVMLVPADPQGPVAPQTAQALAAAGLRIERVPVESAFLVENGRVELTPMRLAPIGGDWGNP